MATRRCRPCAAHHPVRRAGARLGWHLAGACATADGGVSWERRTRRSKRPRSAGAQERHRDGQQIRAEGEKFDCVRNMAFGAADGLICMQNHQGVYRSRDGGGAWEEITEGLPSTLGLPVVAPPRDPGTLWVPPNGGSLGRYPVDAVARVWRSHDGGESWQGFGKGLPPRDFFATVLRQGMANDRADPAGVHFGTNYGSVFASRNEGKSWSEIARYLPTMLSVEVMRQGVCRWASRYQRDRRMFVWTRPIRSNGLSA